MEHGRSSELERNRACGLAGRASRPVIRHDVDCSRQLICSSLISCSCKRVNLKYINNTECIIHCSLCTSLLDAVKRSNYSITVLHS